MSLEEVAALRLPWGWSGPTMPKYRELHTLENPKQFPIRPPHLDHQSFQVQVPSTVALEAYCGMGKVPG